MPLFDLNNPLLFSMFCDIVGRVKSEVWLSLVERYVRDVEAVGSNPVTSRLILQGFPEFGNPCFMPKIKVLSK